MRRIHMNVELATIGERGQVVIPQAIREKMPAPKGTLFSVVLVDKDIIVMKRVDKQQLLGEFRALRNAIKKKFTEAEIVEEIKKTRKE
ncbi:MAG: hypothetical protein AABW64_03970 [Nanoarchaeota archaeon]